MQISYGSLEATAPTTTNAARVSAGFGAKVGEMEKDTFVNAYILENYDDMIMQKSGLCKRRNAPQKYEKNAVESRCWQIYRCRFLPAVKITVFGCACKCVRARAYACVCVCVYVCGGGV